jgi:hypothetical protein
MNNVVAAHRKGPVTLYRAPHRVARPSPAAKRVSALRVTIVAAWKQPVISQLHGWPRSRHVHERRTVLAAGKATPRSWAAKRQAGLARRCAPCSSTVQGGTEERLQAEQKNGPAATVRGPRSG